MPFEEFLESLLGVLCRADFWENETYLSYLARPANERRNDEADIVDLRITKYLLESLGYASNEWKYNRTEGGGGRRPDFVVRIEEYPRPPFVVEDKNTATEYLDMHAPQLMGYMGSLRCPLGILTDGKELIAYEQSAQGVVSLIRLPLERLVEAWAGLSPSAPGKSQAEALPEDMKIALASFYGRFSKGAFVGASALVQDLIYDSEGNLHTEESWPGKSRIAITPADADHFMDSLIRDMRQLISDIEIDVRSQLTLRLNEYAGYGELLGRLREEVRGKIDDLRQGLTILRFAPESIEEVLSLLARDMESRFDAKLIDKVKQNLEQTFADVSRSEEQEDEQAAVQQSIEGVDSQTEPKKRKGRRRLSSRELPLQVAALLQSVGDGLARYHLVRDSQSGVVEVATEVKSSFDLWVSKVAAILLPQAGKERLVKEYSSQTAYVMVVRMLLVRIVEDKELIPRVFTNGGLALWFKEVEARYLRYAEGRGTNFLLEMAYASAQYIYAHFYSDRLIYDWYRPDRNLVIRVLHRLAGYDLSRISHDIIGHVYGKYVEDEHKHESGMYYTPPEVVEYILDRTGFTGADVIGKKVLDAAAGSGSFLVSSARRIMEAYREHYGGEIPPENAQDVIDAVRDYVYGLDLNPFACYLAETNMLIQVLDLVKAATTAGEEVHIGRFQIYNTDTLRFDPRTAQLLRSSLGFSGELLPGEEQIKGRLGAHVDGFDLVVGNPPYVRADESIEVIAYRKGIKETIPIAVVADVLHMKWDLFVPFVALGLYLLRPGGRMGLITSSALQIVPYAERLREQLVEKQIDEVDFFPGVRLFEDAQVENTIVVLTNQAPDAQHEVERRWHSGRPPAVVRSEKVKQSERGAECFRQTGASLVFAGTVNLDELCYISKGMVLNADEKTQRGAFTKDELLSETRDGTHPVAYVEGKDIDPFIIEAPRYLEHGPGLRAPGSISRATFPELYDRKKLMAQRSVSNAADYVSQVVFDDGTWDGYLYTNESAVIILPWHLLNGVDNRSIGQIPDRASKEAMSRQFDILYLLGVLNSSVVSDHLKANRRHEIHVFPDDFRAVPIPDADPEEQEPIASLAKALHEEARAFYSLKRNGWTLELASGSATAPVSLFLGGGVRTLKLSQAKVRWRMGFGAWEASLAGLRVRDKSLIVGRGTTVVSFPKDVPDGAVEWLCRQLRELPPGISLETAERDGIHIPAGPEDAATVMERVRSEEQAITARIENFKTLRMALDQAVLQLYQGIGS